jgi:hypothetical protein
MVQNLFLGQAARPIPFGEIARISTANEIERPRLGALLRVVILS